jgi:DedD protein
MSTPWYLEGEQAPSSRGYFLTRRDLAIVTVGLVALGLLLFTAGLLLGVYALGPPPAAVAAIPEPAPVPAQKPETPTQRRQLPPPVEQAPVQPPAPEPEPELAPAVEPPKPEPAPVEAKPVARAPAKATPAEDAAGFEVQLGFFRQRVNAQQLLSIVQSHGWEAYLVTAMHNGAEAFTVRLGPFSDRAAAEAEAERYRRQERGQALIRPRAGASNRPAKSGEAG